MGNAVSAAIRVFWWLACLLRWCVMAGKVLLRNGNGRVIGSVVGDELVKHCRGSVHMLRVPPAWGVDVDALREAEAAGARWVVVIDDETGARYRASVADCWRHGVHLDRGFGAQVALPLERWQRTLPGEQEAVQLGLW